MLYLADRNENGNGNGNANANGNGQRNRLEVGANLVKLRRSKSQVLPIRIFFENVQAKPNYTITMQIYRRIDLIACRTPSVGMSCPLLFIQCSVSISHL